MIVTFFGNSRQIVDDKILYMELITTLNSLLQKNDDCIFYCGCKGYFDWLCADAIKELQSVYPKIKRYYITPYYSIQYQYEVLPHFKDNFDGIIFPDELTSCPPRLAYIKRNQWMVNNSDTILSYVVIGGGGSEKALLYAYKKNKIIIPIYNSRCISDYK